MAIHINEDALYPDGKVQEMEPATEKTRVRHGKIFGSRGGTIRDPKFRSINLEELNFQDEGNQVGLAGQIALNEIDEDGSAYIDMVALGPLGEFTLVGSINPAVNLMSTLGTAGRAYLFMVAQSYFNPSDIRLKTDIQDIEGALETVNKIRPITYRGHEKDSKKQLGVIAQEIKEVVPEVVGGSEKDYYSVDYSRLVPLLIKSVQELSDKLDSLQKEVNSLKQ